MGRLLTDFVDRAAEFLPQLGAAALLLAVGWLLALLLRFVVRRLYGRFERSPQGRSVENALRRVGLRRPVSVVIGAVVFWGVLIFFITAATEALGLPVITTWLAGVASLLPRVLVGILVVLVGILVGSYAGRAVSRLAASFGLVYGALLGRLLQAAFALIAVVIAVDQVGIQVDFLVAIATVLAASIFGGMALAFGLGATSAVGNIIASHYVQQSFTAGQTVRIGDDEGRIREITSTSVILDVPQGRIHVPAKRFGETVVTLKLGS